MSQATARTNALVFEAADKKVSRSISFRRNDAREGERELHSIPASCHRCLAEGFSFQMVVLLLLQPDSELVAKHSRPSDDLNVEESKSSPHTRMSIVRKEDSHKGGHDRPV